MFKMNKSFRKKKKITLLDVYLFLNPAFGYKLLIHVCLFKEVDSAFTRRLGTHFQIC